MEENLKSTIHCIPFEHLFEITHRVCTEPDLIEVIMDRLRRTQKFINGLNLD